MPYVTTFERLARQEGKLEGAVEQTQKLVLEALDARFNTVPESVSFLLGSITDVNSLQQLFRSAVTTPTLAGFEHRLASVAQAEAA